MAMLGQVQVKGYRTFEDFTIDGLARVNVLVGVNNSGKSALLEAIELLASNGSPRRLWERLKARGQFVSVQGQDEPLLDFAELVHGRGDLSFSGQLEALITISGSPQPTVAWKSLRVGSGEEVRWVGKDVAGSFQVFDRRFLRRDFLTEVRGSFVHDPANVVFVGSGLATPDDLRAGWSKLAGNASEDYVVAALKCIDPRIERVSYASVLKEPRGYEGWYVRRTGEASRVPVSGLGEGMKRALALSVAFGNARGGTLLIDEFENGLHYSVMPELWRFLVRTARTLDAQVFLASHSRDLIDSFEDAERAEGARFDDVAFFRLEAGRKDAVRIPRAVVASVAHTTQDFR